MSSNIKAIAEYIKLFKPADIKLSMLHDDEGNGSILLSYGGVPIHAVVVEELPHRNRLTIRVTPCFKEAFSWLFDIFETEFVANVRDYDHVYYARIPDD